MPNLSRSYAALLRRDDVSSKISGSDSADDTSASSGLSTGAVAGIAIAGAVVLFLIIAPLLVRLAKWQDRRRGILNPPPDYITPHASMNELPGAGNYSTDEISGPRRLRKKSILIDQSMNYPYTLDNDSKRSSVPILPPVFSAGRDSFTLSPFPDEQRKEKEIGQAVYQMRRKSSWIDEDALHGPRIMTPKEKRRNSLLGLGRSLGRRLSLKRADWDVWGRESPTLPRMESGEQYGSINPESRRQSRERSLGSPDIAASEAALFGPRPTSQGSPSRMPKTPGAVIHNPRHRDSLALEAARQLAGKARVPSAQQEAQMRQSATDTHLTEILRMTAERLQDGHGNVYHTDRRQTMYSQGSRPVTQEPEETIEPASPAKSQRSAPAIMLCAELEDTEVSPGRAAQASHHGLATPRHSRQLSTVSMVSEADSLVPGNRISQPEIQTALSSPSRSVKPIEVESPEQRQEQTVRLLPETSTDSSALSTLYSASEDGGSDIFMLSGLGGDDDEDEEIHSPSQMETIAMLEALRSVDELSRFSGDSSRFPFDDLSSLRSSRYRRDTLGQISVPGSTGSPEQGDETYANKRKSARQSGLRFSVQAGEDDPFTVSTPERARLSVLFPAPPFNTTPSESSLSPKNMDSTISSQTSPLARKSQQALHHQQQRKQIEKQTPTHFPTHRKVYPPPQVLRPVLSPDTPELPDRSHSPAISEAALSSVYDSYSYENSPSLSNSPNFMSSINGNQSYPRVSTFMTLPTAESTPARSRSRPAGRRRGRGHERMESNLSQYESAAEIQSPPEYESERNRDGERERRRRSRSSAALSEGERHSTYSQPSDSNSNSHSNPSSNTNTNTNTNTHSEEEEEDAPADLLEEELESQSTLPPLLDPSKLSSLQVTSAVAQLRRMNSAVSHASGVSCVSDVSATTAGDSPTLPALRGGGFSPGKGKSGHRGSRNYLALGSPEGSTGTGGGRSNRTSMASRISEGRGDHRRTDSEVSNRSRARRSTGKVSSSDRGSMVENRLKQLEKLCEPSPPKSPPKRILREGSGNENSNGVNYTTSAVSCAASSGGKRRSEGGGDGGRDRDTPRRKFALVTGAAGDASARASRESLGLYDAQGFLRSSPLRRE